MGWSWNPAKWVSGTTDFLTNPDRWLTPGEHAARRQYGSIYEGLAPTPLDLSWIQRWGEGATGSAQQAYQNALSSTLQRIAPNISARGMWTSPGVRGGLQIQASRPLQQDLAQALMDIQNRQALMTGQARQAWSQENLERLRAQMEAAGAMGAIGIGSEDIFGGLAKLLSSGAEAWGARGGG